MKVSYLDPSAVTSKRHRTNLRSLYKHERQAQQSKTLGNNEALKVEHGHRCQRRALRTGVPHQGL